MYPDKKPGVSKLPPERCESKAFLLAHLSDPHLSSLTGVGLSSLLNKRLLGYLSWYRKRRHIHTPQILGALLEDLAASAPDHVAVTGDLTHLGLPAEFRQAARWLAQLGTPESVTVVPGNHDAYIAAPWRETFAAWEPYLAGDHASSAAIFPSLRIRGPAALIGLSSARPSAPFLAVGTLGRAQLTRLEEMLEQTGKKGLVRIVLLHHPPAVGSIAWRKRLTDAPGLAEVLARQGAELILHGHAHLAQTRELVAGEKRIPVYGVPSASDSRHHPQRTARYHLYRLEKKAEKWSLHISARTFSRDQEQFVASEQKTLFLPMAER